jgi:small subunit ribosomal protein S8
MANHDPISDMLTRIRNASEKRHQSTKVPASRMARSIAKVLQQEGFIAEVTEAGDGVDKHLVLELKYSGKHRQPTIRTVQRVSKPGLRIYKKRPRCPQAGRRWRSALLRLLIREVDPCLVLVKRRFPFRVASLSASTASMCR